MLTWTQLGWEAREVMRTYAVPLAEAVAGGGASRVLRRQGNVCYLNLSSSPGEISAYFVHEMHHAKQARTGNSPGAEGSPTPRSTARSGWR